MRRLVAGFLFLFLSLFPSILYAAEAVPIFHNTLYNNNLVIATNPNASLYWLTVTWNTQAARWLIVYDTTIAPPDGPLNSNKILYCAVVSTNSDGTIGSKSFDWTNHPLFHATTAGAVGMVAIISVDTGGCLFKTADGLNNWITAGAN